MEKDYFIPAIEDVRVGYECELMWESGWRKERVSYNFGFHSGNVFVSVKNALTLESLRTPYLTKEQLEAEGWETYDGGFSFNKNGIHLYYSVYSHYMSIEKGKSPFRAKLFMGECPSINEFRIICKLLGIND